MIDNPFDNPFKYRRDNSDYLQSVKGVQFISIGHYVTEDSRQRIISYY